MSGCMNSMRQVTDAGGGLSGCREHMEMGNPDVFSTRCNKRTDIVVIVVVDLQVRNCTLNVEH